MDNKCIWYYDDEEEVTDSFYFDTCCGHVFHGEAEILSDFIIGFKYCPFCGKKTKFEKNIYK